MPFCSISSAGFARRWIALLFSLPISAALLAVPALRAAVIGAATPSGAVGQNATINLLPGTHVLAGHATKPTNFAHAREVLIGAEDGFFYRLTQK